MMFDITLRDFLKLKKSGFVDVDSDRQGPIMFYEEEELVHLYLSEKSTIYHTVFKKGGTFFDMDGTELTEDSFRLSVLAGSIELMRMPREVRINITQ